MKAIANPDAARGVTLIELLITIVVLSIAIVAIVSGISASTSRSVDPLIQHKSVLLAQAYMDEILGKRFAEATPVGGMPPVTGASACSIGSDGETRTAFDDVDDYDGLDESPPQLQTGFAVADYADFRVTVAVACAGTALGLANNADAKSIAVTITSPDARALTFTAFRGNY
ncbi:MAG: prepilin-type N-terminal cleavage/methylation domain-containing protein [Pseudomonadales bacterium]|nr:prepilin-type N-terminal cleavage/methylation domain-containing protein [Pseudomonadales bacterium]